MVQLYNAIDLESFIKTDRASILEVVAVLKKLSGIGKDLVSCLTIFLSSFG